MDARTILARWGVAAQEGGVDAQRRGVDAQKGGVDVPVPCLNSLVPNIFVEIGHMDLESD